MTFSSLFTGSLLAGILIALGNMMYVCIENKIVAAFLFSIALCFIRIRKLNLFTGSIGRLYFDKNLKIYRRGGITFTYNTPSNFYPFVQYHRHSYDAFSAEFSNRCICNCKNEIP